MILCGAKLTVSSGNEGVSCVRALDWCCGLGGWSDGLAKEGFEVLGIEIEPDIARLYKHDVIVADVRILDGHYFKGFDLIVGSPPCRDFTILGDARWKEKKNPERGLILVHAFLQFVKDAEPRYWLMENVIGLEKYLALKPTVRKAMLTRYMKRNFWGRFPRFLVPMEMTRGKMREGSGWPKLAKWERARIPLPTARALAKAVKASLSSGN